MRLEPVSKDFKEFYEYYLTHPDEGEFITRLVAGAEIDRIMDTHGDHIIRKVYEERYQTLKKSLAKAVADNTMSNEAIDATVEAVETVSKALSGTIGGVRLEYTPEERRKNAKEQRRGPGGRFVTMGKKKTMAGNYSHQRHSNPDSMLPDTLAVRALTEPDRRQMEDAYDNIVRTFESMGAPQDITHIRVVMEDGSKIIRPIDEPLKTADFAGQGRKVDSYRFLKDTGAPYQGPKELSGEVSVNQRSFAPMGAMKEFKDGGNDFDRSRMSGASRSFERLNQAGKYLDESGLSNVPGGAAAADAARFVGEAGPHVDRVAGKAIRRAAYRYQGREKKPEKAMLNAMGYDTKGANDPEGARDMLMIPREETIVTPHGYEDVPVPSKFLRYWQSRLPSTDLLELQLSSGAMAPSEGVMLDKTGRPVVQSVGTHDDHYLPFNLKHMNKVKGGEYVRTRTVGGLTSEDIDGGVIGGAKAVTVVSHSGIFTMEFNKSGKSPMNKARRVKMRKRYEHLVDSLASERVTPNVIPPDRMIEIREQAARERPGTTAGMEEMRRAREKELKKIEAKNPTPSQATKDEWTDEYLEKQGEKWTDKNGQPLGVDQLKAELSLKAGKQLTTNEEFITALGVNKEYEKYIQYKETEYRSKLGPLKNNGEGYYKAMRALKEQFPYDIAEVRWTPPDAESLQMRDTGYVKPKHLRPDDVKTGYWDPEVEGYLNPGEYKETKLKNTGKRRASLDNLSSNKARERLKERGWYDAKNKDVHSFSEGGGESTASFSTQNSAVKRGRFGPQYTGFKQSSDIHNVELTDYQQAAQIMKIRSALKNMGTVAYIKPDDGKKARYNPWDLDDNPTTVQYPALFSAGSDDEFQRRLSTDDQFAAQVVSDIQSIYSDGRGSERGVAVPIARVLEGKGLFKGLVTGAGVPQNPTNAMGVIGSLASGDDTQYDFTQEGGLDGTLYLPGLTRREYDAAWNADPDIAAFTASSEQRFGHKFSLEEDNRKVARLATQYGKAFREGMDTAQNWRQQIATKGQPDKVPHGAAEVVRYGGRDYSIFAVDELENDIARDALAVAKIKQLRKIYGGSSNSDLDEQGVKVISLEEARERKTMGVKDVSDVSDLKFERSYESIDKDKLDDAQTNLNELVGLDEVKQEFDHLIDDALINRRRAEVGLPEKKTTMHLIFSGDPGTGKTTVAHELARAYNALGLIPGENVEVATRADLVGEYAGHTAAKTRRKFEKAKGGVLFIDEAYSLVNSEDDSFGFEAVDELVSLSEENRDNTIVILAGYPSEMNRLMSANPGLKSRFPRTIHFPNYSAEELGEITRRGSKKLEYEYGPGADKAMAAVAAKIAGSSHYSNARDGRNFREMLERVQGQRVAQKYGAKATKDDLSLITVEDVKRADKLYFSQRTGSVA